MRTIELILPVEEDLHELLIAELSDLDFESFVQEEAQLKAYVPAPRWSDVHRERVEQWLRAHGLPAPLEERVVEPRNWNAEWERTVQPTLISPFLVKPTWAEVPGGHEDKVVLEIDPKMSFGTGYHESTRLALRLLAGLVRGGERVLDAGTGTGILAIAALRLGAASALAFDLSEWAALNAPENFLLNGVAEDVSFRAGSLDAVPEAGFDLICANINRRALLELLPGFRQKMSAGGALLLSGLLKADRAELLEAAAAQGLHPEGEKTEGEWWAVALGGRGKREGVRGKGRTRGVCVQSSSLSFSPSQILQPDLVEEARKAAAGPPKKGTNRQASRGTPRYDKALHLEAFRCLRSQCGRRHDCHARAGHQRALHHHRTGPGQRHHPARHGEEPEGGGGTRRF